MKFSHPILPTDEALRNPVANLIRNNYREQVENVFSIARSTRDAQYKAILYDRGRDIWRTAIYLSNQYAIDNPHLTQQPKKTKPWNNPLVSVR